MEPLRAHSWAEAHLYLKVTPCEACSRGPWEVKAEPDETQGHTLRARCLSCGAEKEFIFECPAEPDAKPLDVAELEALPVELISSSASPSEIIDLGQWLSLFYHLVETASKAKDKDNTRRLTFQAAQCLDEALKFYTADGELPPQSAFFTEASRGAFAGQPERFARERLRDMRSKLPDMRLMASRLARDARKTGQSRWWQFWKR
jgi:hypothetical protein